MKLTYAQRESLREAARGTTRPDANSAKLEALGLVVTGRSRFGAWVRATERGQQLCSAPAAVPGPAKAGILLRGSTPRLHRAVESEARPRTDTVSSCPVAPTGALKSGETAVLQRPGADARRQRNGRLPAAKAEPVAGLEHPSMGRSTDHAGVPPPAAKLSSSRPRGAAPLPALLRQLTMSLLHGPKARRRGTP